MFFLNNVLYGIKSLGFKLHLALSLLIRANLIFKIPFKFFFLFFTNSYLGAIDANSNFNDISCKKLFEEKTAFPIFPLFYKQYITTIRKVSRTLIDKSFLELKRQSWVNIHE